MPTPRRIAEHEVMNLLADEVRPGMVTLNGVVLDVEHDGSEGVQPEVFMFRTPGRGVVIATAGSNVTVIGALHPLTLQAVREADAVACASVAAL